MMTSEVTVISSEVTVMTSEVTVIFSEVTRPKRNGIAWHEDDAEGEGDA